MKVSHKEPPRISVWLDDSDDTELKRFHCIVCGKVVFEYYSSVKIIIPGEHTIKRPKVIQCHGTIDRRGEGDYRTERCKAKYWIS